MYPIGFLFGLGFDTTSEVGLLALTALGTQKALPPVVILLLPTLFTLAMCLLDTLDGILMLGAYRFALKGRAERVFFNLYLTSVSAGVALTVAVTETLGCIQSTKNLSGPFWSVIKTINDNFDIVGYVIVGVFVLSLIGAYVAYRCIFSSDGGGSTAPSSSSSSSSQAQAETGKTITARGSQESTDAYLHRRLLNLATEAESSTCRVVV